MRASAAILIFATLPCFIQTLNSRVKRDLFEKVDVIDDNVFNSAKLCATKLGISKCVAAFGTWEADEALRSQKMPTFNRDNFPWQYFGNVSNEELNERLYNRTLNLLQRRSLKMNLFKEYNMQLVLKENGLLSVDVSKSNYFYLIYYNLFYERITTYYIYLTLMKGYFI